MISPTRRRALVLWALCTLCLPLLWIMQLLQGLFGSPSRSINMAISLDTCGNALTGGDPRMTLSERTGLAVMDGKRWGLLAAPVIDTFFGKDHCREEALLWQKRFLLNG